MIIIRKAGQEDNSALVALARQTPMGGTISVRVDRDPDFFRMIRARGGGIVLAACEGRQIVGTISSSVRPFVLAGQCRKVAFVADFRVRPDLKGRGIAYRLCRAMGDHLRNQGPELITALIADGNERALAFIQGRMKLPKFRDLGKFTTYQLFPTARKVRNGDYEIRLAQKNDRQQIQVLRHGFNERYIFYSASGSNPLADHANPDRSQECAQDLVALKNGKLVGVLGLHDANDLKQIVINRLPGALRMATAMLSFGSRFLPIPRFPLLGEAVRILYLRHLAHMKNHGAAGRALIKAARRLAYERQCMFAMIGFHERDSANELVRGIPYLKFVAQGFMTSTLEQGKIPGGMETGVLLEDFSLV